MTGKMFRKRGKCLAFVWIQTTNLPACVVGIISINAMQAPFNKRLEKIGFPCRRHESV